MVFETFLDCRLLSSTVRKVLSCIKYRARLNSCAMGQRGLFGSPMLIKQYSMQLTTGDGILARRDAADRVVP